MNARPHIAIVGPCASGKSTLCAALQSLGHDAYVVAQEHSDIANLWSRRSPDLVIALHVSLGEIRRRRHEPTWRDDVYAAQHHRLESATESADLVLETDSLSPEGMLAKSLLLIDQFALVEHESRAGHHRFPEDANG